MAESDRAEAQRRREDARRQRRSAEDGGGGRAEPADTADANGGPHDEPHAAIRNAAKAAAAGAALGAAVGAALAARETPSEDGDDAPPRDATDSRSADTAVQEQERQPQADEESEDGERLDDEPTGVADGPEAVDEPTDDASRAEPPTGGRDEGAPRQGASPDETVDVARRAREQLQALHGREPESVSALERTAQGWTVSVEVVELPRVPDSTDVMASYELLLDDDKNLIRYSRRRRYYRSQADRGDDA